MKTIVLTGMPGAGKTTAGQKLASVIGTEFIDSDFEIERSEQKKISEIFEQNGEEYFRNLEKQIIKKIFKNKDLVLSIGGGAFQDKNTRDFLIKNANVIYLAASAENIFYRTKNNTDRPLLNKNLSVKKLDKMLKSRAKNYEYAQYKITTDDKNIDEVIKEILECVNLK